jgi:hypothetical protein
MLRKEIPNSEAEMPIYKLIGILGVLVMCCAIAILTSSLHFLVLGKDFTPLFWQYAETYLPQGMKKHREDAIA